MAAKSSNDVRLTVITRDGSLETGSMPERDARIVESLAALTGAIAARTR